MSRQIDPVAGRKALQTQLENYKATRENCREPQRSVFSALIAQLESELNKWNVPVDVPTAEPIHAHSSRMPA